MRVFLDANILFSAAWKDESAAALLFELGGAGFCHLTTSRLALEEAAQNIARKHAGRLPALRQYAGLVEIGREPKRTHLAAAAAFGLPDKDIPILAAAIAQGAELLVTGDRRDFGHLYGQRPGGVEVIGLNGAIERIIAQPKTPYRERPTPLGETRAGYDLTKALALGAMLEDEEILRKLRSASTRSTRQYQSG